MKKRIRRKLHIGEFKQFGNVIAFNTDGKEETAEALLDKFERLIDEYSLTVAGGGTGRILMPSRKNNKYIPTLAATLVTAVAQEQPLDQMMFCVYVKGASEVPQSAIDAIKETFASENVQVGNNVEIWRSV